MKQTIKNFTMYGLNDLQGEFNKYAEYNFDTSSLRNKFYKHATIIPYKEKHTNGQLLYPREGGVFDSEHKIIEDSKLTWGDIDLEQIGVSVGYSSEFPSHTNFIDEDVVYLGHVDAHFGHFLVDSLQRMYLYLNNDIKWLRAVYISNGEDKFMDFFTIFGIQSSNLLRINTPTTFRSVLVGAPSVNYHYFCHKNFKLTCDEIRNNIPGKKYSKIYLSRSQINSFGKVYGEELFEDIFRSNGFKIIFPEQISIKEQISYVKNCKILAGTSGSAMHLSLFISDNTKCIHILRSNHVLPMQLLFDRLKNLQSTYVEGFENILPVNICYSPYFIKINNYVENFFCENDFKNPYTIKYRKKDVISFILNWIKAKYLLRGNYKFKDKLSFYNIYKLFCLLIK